MAQPAQHDLMHAGTDSERPVLFVAAEVLPSAMAQTAVCFLFSRDVGRIPGAAARDSTGCLPFAVGLRFCSCA